MSYLCLTNNNTIFMRNFITIVLSILSFFISVSAQTPKTGWEKYGLKGKVKEVREYGMKKPGGIKKKGSLLNSRSFDAKGNKVEQCYYYDDDSLNYKDVYKYDSNNNMIEECWYKADGSLFHKGVFKYESNNLTELYVYNSDSLKSKNILKYDEDNNKIEECLYKPDGSLICKRVYKYDSNNNKIEMYKQDFYDNGLELEHYINYIKYKYDSNNNMIEECWYMADSSLSVKTTIKYDENNNKIEEISCLHDGSLLSKSTFKYDSNNNVVEKAIYISDGSLISKRLYKYDSHNNCIEIKNVTYGNGSIIEYEYYK